MELGRAFAQKGLDMGLGAIALVPGKTVGGKLFAQFRHQGVACNLGDDAGGGNREAAPVAVDNRGVGAGEIIHRQSVHQRVLRQRRQLEQGPAHGQMRGLADIVAVNFRGVRQAHADFHAGGGMEEVGKMLPLAGRQLLGVGQTCQAFRRFRLQPGAGANYRGGHYRAGQGAASGFVHAGQAAVTAFPPLAFKSQQVQLCMVFNRACLPVRSRR